MMSYSSSCTIYGIRDSQRCAAGCSLHLSVCVCVSGESEIGLVYFIHCFLQWDTHKLLFDSRLVCTSLHKQLKSLQKGQTVPFHFWVSILPLLFLPLPTPGFFTHTPFPLSTSLSLSPPEAGLTLHFKQYTSRCLLHEYQIIFFTANSDN